MRRDTWRPGVLLLLALGAGLGFALRSSGAPGAPASAGRPPRIHPEVAGLILPPNIAPLNFRVDEPGDRYRAKVAGGGKQVEVESGSPSIRFPEGRWREVLRAAAGGSLAVEVSVRRGGRWQRFAALSHRVAAEEIDRYLVFRRIKPFYNLWSDVGIYQRDLEGFGERPVVQGKRLSNGCVNCHSFRANHTDAMAIGTRSETLGDGTLVAQGGRVRRMDARWGYTSWHPQGRIVAYSLNKVRQFFHPAGPETRDVVDLDSDIVVHDLQTNKVVADAAFADPDRLETYPAWSADGRALYFCSARFPWQRRDRVPPRHYDQARYDLMRVAYDPATGRFGPRETVLSSQATGLSILLPRPSPDGRFLLFCMCRYGCFPVFQPSSDLYLLDLRTGKHRRLEINSDRSESWHSWSSNGRWIVFSSKRADGVFTRPYVSYVDAAGKVSRPFVLPQQDPEFYDSCLNAYSVPELVCEPVRVGMRQLVRAARSKGGEKARMPVLSMTAKKPAGASKGDANESPWKAAPAR